MVNPGGVNPGTPAYVGYLCIILRRQKHTSRYICITPLLVKLAYCPAAKKIMVDTYVSFFQQEPSTCAPVRACARAVLRRSELFLPCFQNFFRVIYVFRALASARKNLPLSYCYANATTAVALPVPTPRRQRQRFHANATTAAVAAAPLR